MKVILISAIVYLYINEWRQLEKLEQEVKYINVLRQKLHDTYAKKLELAMYGETILEWEATDTVRYRTKRLQLDSLLCEFKQDYPPHRLDSLRRLLKDKENQLFNNTFDEFDIAFYKIHQTVSPFMAYSPFQSFCYYHKFN